MIAFLRRLFTSPPSGRGTGWTCTICGGSDVEVLEWARPNENYTTDVRADIFVAPDALLYHAELDHTFCYTCTAHTLLKYSEQ